MKLVRHVALSLGFLLMSGVLHAETAWPERPITFVVPYAPGGYTDVVARIVARYVEKALGKSIIIEARPGAGGIVGTQSVAKAAPDGYTLCVCSVGAISVAPFAQKIGYDPLQELMPVSVISTIVQTVIVKNSLPVKSMAELVAYAKAHDGKLNYSSSGAGGLTHYSVELFQVRTGTHAVHIPFKGGAPSTAAVVSGDVDFAFANITDALPQIQAGTVRALAVTSLGRSPFLPDIPSVHETVIPNFLAESWNGIMAPAKTPEPIISKLSGLLMAMADDPEINEAMRKLGSSTVKGTPAQFRTQIQNEMEQWKPLIKEIMDREKKT